MDILRRINYADKNEKIKGNIEFQITNIRANDVIIENDDQETTEIFYRIQLFGVTQGGHTVHICIDDFTPFFFVLVPDSFDNMQLRVFVKNLKKMLVKQKLDDYIIEDKCKLIKKKKMIGFTNNKEFKFARIVFNNYKTMKACATKITNYIQGGFEVCESNVEPVMRFLHLRNIEPAGWVNIKKFKVLDAKASTCHIYVQTSNLNVEFCEDQNRLAPIMCCAFDIECTSLDGSFPDPLRESDECIMIASIFRQYLPNNSKSCVKVVHTLKKCDIIDENDTRNSKGAVNNTPIVIFECENEAELLLSWRKMIQTMDPDYIYGYNSNGFDWNYIHERAKRLKKSYGTFMKLNRLKGEVSNFVTKQLSSSALGDNIHKYIDMSGRIILDVMKEVQKAYNLEMWKLDFVANHFLKSNKVDLSPQELFNNFNVKGTKEAIREIAVYCIQDTELCNDLVWKLNIIIKAIKMANVCSVPSEYIFYRGQGIKIFSLVSKECRKENIIMPVIKKPSMYHLTEKQKEEEEERLRQEAKYQGALVIETDGGLYYEPIVVLDFNSLYPSCINAWNISFDTIVLDPKYDNIPGAEYETISYEDYDGKTTVCKYIQTIDGVAYEGIFPKILKKLLATRKEFKKLMEAESDPFKKSLLNGSQLAYKVVANSCYGQCGARTSPIYYKKIAACTTAKGREMLMRAKEIGEKCGLFNVECVYGDSVAKYTPILLRNKHNGLIIIKTIEEICKNHLWAPYENFKLDEDITRREKMQSTTHYEVWTDLGWSPIKRVIKHKVNKKMYRIMTHTGIVDVTEDHSLLSSNLKHIKPGGISIGSTELLQSYPIKLTDHTNNINKRKYYYIHGQVGAMKLFHLLRSHGYKVIIEETHNLYKLTIVDDYKEKTNVVRHVIDLGYTDDFVYDLETEVGRFQAGIGEIIVKNTDSNFYLVLGLEKLSPIEKIREAMRIGREMSAYITQALGKPGIIIFAYEKILYPHLQITKKRYYSIKYEDNPDKGVPNGMGLALKRRNYCRFTKDIMQGVLDLIMNYRKDEVVHFVNNMLNNLVNGDVAYELLRMTQTLKMNYKVAPAHKYLADRMIARGETVNVNDRIPFIYAMHAPVYNTRGTPVKKQVKDIIEEYNYARGQGIGYDPEMYIENQIREPVAQIMQFIVDDPQELFNKAIELIRANKISKYGPPVKAERKKKIIRKDS